MADDITYYDLLGVKPDATVEEIKKGYTRAARVNHPDSGVPGAGYLFSKVNDAWETLKNADKRAAYDRSLKRETAQQRQPEATQEPLRRSAPSPASRAEGSGDVRQTAPQDAGFAPAAPLQPQAHGASPVQDSRPISEKIKDAGPGTWIAMFVGVALWVLWAALCRKMIFGIGSDGSAFAFMTFFLVLGLTFLMVRFSRDLAPVPAFIFAAITLPIPVTGLVSSGFSSTSWIFVVALLGYAAALGHHFLLRPTLSVFKPPPRQPRQRRARGSRNSPQP